ncbi:terminase small subunit [Liquorilactobacillus nagelii]|uniref:terminase small subunit n=1 Tax=Liquorilactobacillus nagelii TaxID=82688 RepID=UPI0006F160EB|nr:terminase small subunit [Liquorilactobacillus nagelii]KRL40721.1 Terminase small subunit [Liquorilactobacillus nagelii DSM 13675]QYH53683.1 terminase small subunit [Liquorilactobacillus nagelii DSM 13675]
MNKRLTVKQKKFADEYIISGNATSAAVKAGYSKNYAHTNDNKLLQNTTVKSYLTNKLKELDSAKVADMKEVMEYLTSVLRGEQTETVATAKGLYDDVEVSAKDRIKAAELIGKRYGAWTDKKEINGDLTIDIGVGDYDD